MISTFYGLLYRDYSAQNRALERGYLLTLGLEESCAYLKENLVKMIYPKGNDHLKGFTTALLKGKSVPKTGRRVESVGQPQRRWNFTCAAGACEPSPLRSRLWGDQAMDCERA